MEYFASLQYRNKSKDAFKKIYTQILHKFTSLASHDSTQKFHVVNFTLISPDNEVDWMEKTMRETKNVDEE